MRVGFVTCVELGLACMREIENVGGHLSLVITLPDNRAPSKSGRVFVDDFCTDHGAELVKVPNINDDLAVGAIRRHRLDWLFVIGWSQIAGIEVLSAPAEGVLGMHPTLLPVGRGRAAIPWAILKGLTETGVTLFQLDEGVDTGPVVAQLRVPIAQDETATSLYQKVAVAHRKLIGTVWPELEADTIHPIPQRHEDATEWPGRTPGDGLITPEMSIDEVDRLVRATTRPYPGAFWLTDTATVRVWGGRRALSSAIPHGAFRLHVADGSYDALEYEILVR